MVDAISHLFALVMLVGKLNVKSTISLIHPYANQGYNEKSLFLIITYIFNIS